ncbi:MAG: alpha/beta fold hydrolase [Roseitalea sp.]|nr:alpha/beta fold hydrolase [Roseitalea sp.]MBO6950328.1 alpha/beta fold hydrolase [Rhizobiaceae bacterium]MBO6591683.1 alpha/beta fold hydrolase [Roseitalea sp.]MBO6599538.1 alpha/beta fold hydrolase [Roseitalea sp.]MBO6611974.1 alpha/beta fold hydrolase [Roseitalea sp.]
MPSWPRLPKARNWYRSVSDAMARETLCLLPGMMCDGRLFAPQVDALGTDHDIVIGDITGAETMAGLADGLLAQLPDRFNLAGLSMGGIVAQEMARKAPGRVMRLALLDTSFGADSDRRKAIRDDQIARARAGGLRELFLTEMKPHYLAEANSADTDLNGLFLDMAMILGPDVFARQSLALRDRPDQTGTLSGFAGPSLVLCGAEDRMCPPVIHEQMAALLPDADLVIVEGAGHITTLEAPDAVNAALAAWLARPA